jgi:antirestriction protein ArdC
LKADKRAILIAASAAQKAADYALGVDPAAALTDESAAVAA